MNVLFKALGFLLAGRTYRRMDGSPGYCSAIAAYTVLSMALGFWF